MTPSSYSFDFNFGLLILVLSGLAIAFILLTFPYHLFRESRSNWYRSDGNLSAKRFRKETRKLAGLTGELLLFPLVGSAVVVGVLMVVHTFLIPIPLLVDVAGMFSTDADVWEERTETGELGDVGLLYGEWSDEQGFSEDRAFGVRKFLKRNWYMVAGLGVIFGIMVHLFFTGYYVSCLAEYQEGLIRRRRHYAEHDGLT
ncbi:MAG: hypothetical protein HKN43_16150 [Rhodothermales bacterium]|nr:hypothetical protein [Rhodothermales bacterium]